MTRLMFQALLVGAVMLPFGGGAHRKTEQGNRSYLEGNLDDALRFYTDAQVDLPEAPELVYDIGNVLYRQGDFQGAAEAYTKALLAGPRELVGPSAYNLGNARFQLEEYEEAVRSFERAVRSDPADLASKRNLELALRALQEQQSNEEPQSSPDGEEGEEGEEDQQQQQEQGEGDQEGNSRRRETTGR